MPRSERPNMAAYGVPVDDPEGLLPWEWAEERLLPNRNYWVVTVDPAGRPHSMPVWGLWVAETERFWFSCAADSLKARNLTANPHIVVTTEDTVEVVSIEGQATAVPPSRPIADAIGQKYDSTDVNAETLAAFMMQQGMYEVTPVKGFGLIERPEEFGPRATRWIFD